MAKKISGSVGKGGKNKPEDTKIVQELLNGFAKKGGFKRLDVDGLIGPKTIAAIKAFQQNVVEMKRGDGRVDPGGQTLGALAKGPKKLEAEAKKEEKQQKKEAEAAKNEQAGGKPQVKGDVRGVDRRLLGVLEAVSAHYGKPIVVEAGKQSAAGGEQLWQEWTNSLDRGRRDPSLRRDDKLREELDGLYSDLKKKDFLKLASKKLAKSKGSEAGAHAAGRAVDIKRNTDAKVVAALATVLRKQDEGNVIHFDDAGKSLPKTISEAMKKKWK